MLCTYSGGILGVHGSADAIMRIVADGEYTLLPVLLTVPLPVLLVVIITARRVAEDRD